jgi:hypothetical protein
MEKTMGNKNKRSQASYWWGINIGAICLLCFLFAYSGIKEGDHWKAAALACAGMGLVVAFQPSEANED